MTIFFKKEYYIVFGAHSLDGSPAYPFNCTFFSFIYLTAKALRRITMHGFLVGATEPEKRTLNIPFFVNDSWCKRVQLRNPEL